MCEYATKEKKGGRNVQPFLWFLVLLVSATTAAIITWPLARKVTALEKLVEMLADTIRGKFDKK